jgi:acyl transferase domain-containing protein
MLLQPESDNGWDELLAEQFTTDRRPLVVGAFGANDRDPQRSLLGIFARMWLHGARIDWRSFHAGKKRSRVPLPTYPFERVSYWLPIPQAPSTLSEPTTAQDARRSEREFFVPSWQVCAIPTRAGVYVPEKGECWLIFSDGALGEQLAGRLEAAGCLPVIVLPGSSFASIGERRYTVAPESAADYSRLLRELQQLNLDPKKFVHCWTLAGAPVDAFSIERFKQRQTQGYFSLLYLAKALAGQTRASGRSLIVATRVTYHIAGSDECDLSNATIPGLCKVMAQELPSLSCKVLDLGARDDAPMGVHQSHDTDVERVIAEGAPSDPVVAYRGELRFLQTLQPHRFAESEPCVGELRQGGVYVILGGTGKLGLAIAKRLASTCQARLILIARRPLPFRDSSAAVDADPDTQALAAKLKEIELLGAEVDVVCADVRNEAQLEGAFAHTESRFGRVDGVFHLAADMSHPSVSRPLIELSPQDVEAQMGPKVAGVYALAGVLRSREPDFVVLFSSNSSTLGGIGFGAYAAANSFLDIWASIRSLDSRIRWICTNWDRWVTHESHPTSNSNIDRYTIGIEAGLDALWLIVSRSQFPQVIVAKDIQERLERWVLRRRSPQPSEASAPAATRVPPRSELERTIAKIWQEALGCGEVGVHDTFFDLGGDSLIGLGILARVKEIFQVELPLEVLIGSKVTVASLVPRLVAELQNTQAKQSVA